MKPEGITETDEEARERRAKRVLDSKGYRPNTTKLNGMDYIVDKNGTPDLLRKIYSLFGYDVGSDGRPIAPYMSL